MYYSGFGLTLSHFAKLPFWNFEARSPRFLAHHLTDEKETIPTLCLQSYLVVTFSHIGLGPCPNQDGLRRRELQASTFAVVGSERYLPEWSHHSCSLRWVHVATFWLLSVTVSLGKAFSQEQKQEHLFILV